MDWTRQYGKLTFICSEIVDLGVSVFEENLLFQVTVRRMVFSAPHSL